MEPMTTDLPPPMTTDQFTALPPPPAASNQTHPPYPEMITGAISALKDKDGSSRQAISKYIEKEFAAYLPPTHSTLLTHHLKRLKNLGQLVMVKHSYMLPPPPPIRSTQLQPNYQTVLEFGGDAFHLDNSGSLKRKPGRPPKLKPVPGLRNQPVPVPSYDPQFHYNNINNNNDGSEPLFASLGLGDDGALVAPPPPALPAPPASETPEVVVKRGRGRPPKSAAAGGKIQAHVAKPGGQIQPQAADPGEIQVVEAGSGRPGRKPNVVKVKRGRGRPKRIGFGAVTVPLSGNYLRPRGRPKRVVRPKVAAVNGVGVGEGSRRRGRPSRNMIGKPLGSLSKGGPGTAVIVTDPHQLVAYQELKSKYEHLQSKVKQVASMVKSCIDPDYGNTALGALQELEDLAAEVNARSNP